MRILFITNNLDVILKKGRIYEEIEEISKEITELHVIVFTCKKDGFNFKSKKVKDNLYVYPTNSLFPIFYFTDALSIFKLNLVWLSECIVDLVVADGNMLSFITSFVFAKKQKRNFLVNIPGNIVYTRSYLNRVALSFILDRSSGVRVPTYYDAEALYSLNPALLKRIYILPFFEELEENLPLLSRKEVDIHNSFPDFNVILLHAPNYGVTLKSFKQNLEVLTILRDRYPRIGLVVLGNIYRNFMERFYKFPDNVIFDTNQTGDGKNVQSYLKTANIYLDLSNRVPGVTLVNAALLGCPVVTIDNNFTKEIVKDGFNGFLLKDFNAKLAARKIIEILEYTGLREKMMMYRYSIISDYGKDKKGYFKRLTNIWSLAAKERSNKMPETEIQKTIKSLHAELGQKVKKYKVYTLDSYRKVVRKIESEYMAVSESPLEKKINFFDAEESELFNNIIDLD